MERRLLFPGCLILARFQNYELAAKSVMSRLGMELLDMDEFACCSSSVAQYFSEDWINLTVYNLALAEARGLDILTLCGSCTRTLRLAQHRLDTESGLLAQVNDRLAKVGLQYHGGVRVNHIIEALHQRLAGIEAGRAAPHGIGLDYRVAVSHPCNAIRPAAIMQLDDPWQPRKMREIVAATGAAVVDYKLETECCGATLLMVREDWAVQCARDKLRSAVEAGAELLAVACGNCYLLLQRFQDRIIEESPELALPVIFLPQLVGLSLGVPPERLGLSAGELPWPPRARLRSAGR